MGMHELTRIFWAKPNILLAAVQVGLPRGAHTPLHLSSTELSTGSVRFSNGLKCYYRRSEDNKDNKDSAHAYQGCIVRNEMQEGYPRLSQRDIIIDKLQSVIQTSEKRYLMLV
jgi:hypothetical protein